MKEGIHPTYERTTIRCACGNVIETRSTKKDIRVEVCSKRQPLQQEVRFGKLNDFVFGPVPSRHGFFRVSAARKTGREGVLRRHLA